VLRIGDDGIGYPENVDYQSSKSLGLKLIHNLSRQLKGSVIRDLSKRGTNYIIRFQEVRQDPFHSIA
jgi:two-component sensor histidine kinase